MKTPTAQKNWINRTRIILLVVIPALLPLGAIALYAWLPTLLLKYFFFSKGFMAWTLTEYAMHRWAFHERQHKGNKDRNLFNHTYHHTHPSDMIISPLMRGLSIVVFALAIWSVVQGPVLLTYFTGWLTGLSSYSLMHYFLHQPLAAKVFPNLVKQHIWHHTKYATKCFGVTTTFWDRIFKTLPIEFKELPAQAVKFYYRQEECDKESVEMIMRRLHHQPHQKSSIAVFSKRA